MSLLPHKKHHDDAEFDITAMIDLVFLMNIYFMFLFITKAGGEIPDMPTAMHAAPLELDETMTIVVMAGPDPNFVAVKLEGVEGEFTDPGVQEDRINKASDIAQAAKKTKLLIKAQKAVRLREIQRIVGIALREDMTLHVAVMEASGKEEKHE
ncbi:ExbD/TolR family protein [Anatilimnocola floriformis]|uniref:ExbD/TolR family protein n=1 Tax=Anatilimnocola floriformis TaxID=2948575 RepID=UPI0020C310F3|nr:biopolymer transporter ExbD [Anatilimnocola floriformis]